MSYLLDVVFCTSIRSLYSSIEFKSSASLLVFVPLIYLLLKVWYSRFLQLLYCLFLPCYQLVFSQYIYVPHVLERDFHTESSTYIYVCVFVSVCVCILCFYVCIYVCTYHLLHKYIHIYYTKYIKYYINNIINTYSIYIYLHIVVLNIYI